MDHIELGDVTVTRINEFYGSVEMSPSDFFPESSERDWEDNRRWLAPDFWDPESNTCISAIQTWMLRSEGRTILVDTGVGNHKERPYAEVWSRRDTAFLDNLAAAGVQPEDVDLVVNTHLHIDHVGWNTRLDGRTWVPTFPNATYLMTERDFDFWNPANDHRPIFGRGNQNVFEDSVAPVHQAEQSADALAPGPAAEIDLLIGTNAEEGNLYLVPQGNFDTARAEDVVADAARACAEPQSAVDTLMRARPQASPGELRSAVIGDALFGIGTTRMAEAHSLISRRGTYVYSFDFRSTALDGRLGAWAVYDHTERTVQFFGRQASSSFRLVQRCGDVPRSWRPLPGSRGGAPERSEPEQHPNPCRTRPRDLTDNPSRLGKCMIADSLIDPSSSRKHFGTRDVELDDERHHRRRAPI